MIIFTIHPKNFHSFRSISFGRIGGYALRLLKTAIFDKTLKIKMYKYQHIVEEMTNLILEGYNSKDSFKLILEKFYMKGNKLFLVDHDLQQIFVRGASKGYSILDQRRKKGIPVRKFKKLKKDPLSLNNDELNNETFSPLFSNIYSKPLTLEEKIEMKYKEFKSQYRNRTKAINETLKFLKTNYSDSSDIRFDKVLEVVKKIEN